MNITAKRTTPQTSFATDRAAYGERWRPDEELVELHSSPRDQAERRLMWRSLECTKYDSYTNTQWEGAILLEIAKNKSLPDDWRRDAAALGKEMVKGHGVTAAATRAKITYGRASALISSQHKQIKATPQMISTVKELCSEGMSYKRIGEEVGISYGQVVNILRHYK